MWATAWNWTSSKLQEIRGEIGKEKSFPIFLRTDLFVFVRLKGLLQQCRTCNSGEQDKYQAHEDHHAANRQQEFAQQVLFQ